MKEIANTREMVALSLLQPAIATEASQGRDYTGRMQTMEARSGVCAHSGSHHDASVNVRLAAVDALSKSAGIPRRPAVAPQSCRRRIRHGEAALIDYLVDARDRQALGTLRSLHHSRI